MGGDVTYSNNSHDVPDGFYKRIFGNTEFMVPKRYSDLTPKGFGAQGMVW